VSTTEAEARPSAHARELLLGAYDLHVHIAPDLIPRSSTDVAVAQRFAEWGMAGFVLKSHYVPTAERAEVVRATVPAVRVLGSLALNAGVGGLNPLAVEIAARQGARIVWLPTVDAENEAIHLAHNPGAKRAAWAAMQDEFSSLGIYRGPVRVVESGRIRPELGEVLDVVAAHDVVLATGHLSRDEIFIVADAAIVAGVGALVITHPDYPTQRLSIDDQRRLAKQGAVLERCLVPLLAGKASWEHVFAGIRATGVESNVLSTDLGQVGNPPVEDGLALWVDRLVEAGFADDEIRTMAVTNTRRLGGERDG